MRWIAASFLGVLAALAVWVVLGRSGAGGGLRVEWRPAAPLSPGVSVREGKLAHSPSWRLIDLSVDLTRAELRITRREGGGVLESLVPDGAVAAVNGGYFDERYRPTGWLVDRGVELAPEQHRNTGGVLAVREGALFIGPTGEVPFSPEVALQNSPRLIEPGGALGIHTDDGKRAARTMACDAAGRLHLVVILAPLRSGPTLLEAAQILAADPLLGGLGCTSALNLDGGPSTGLWLAPASGIASVPPATLIGYALSIVPR